MEFHSTAGRWMLEGYFFAQMFANGFWNSRPQLSIKTYLITRHFMQVCLIQTESFSSVCRRKVIKLSMTKEGFRN